MSNEAVLSREEVTKDILSQIDARFAEINATNVGILERANHDGIRQTAEDLAKHSASLFKLFENERVPTGDEVQEASAFLGLCLVIGLWPLMRNCHIKTSPNHSRELVRNARLTLEEGVKDLLSLTLRIGAEHFDPVEDVLRLITAMRK